jgi:hypothetical protein
MGKIAVKLKGVTKQISPKSLSNYLKEGWELA